MLKVTNHKIAALKGKELKFVELKKNLSEVYEIYLHCNKQFQVHQYAINYLQGTRTQRSTAEKTVGTQIRLQQQ